MKLGRKDWQLLGLLVVISYVHGRYGLQYVTPWLDQNAAIIPPVALVIQNLGNILLGQCISYFVFGKKLKVESVSLGLAGFFALCYADYFEAPFAILSSGEPNMATLGWKSSSDTTIWWFLKNYGGMSGPALAQAVYNYGAICFLVLTLLLGGFSFIKKQYRA